MHGGVVQILHLAKLLKASKNIIGEVVHRYSVIWMALRTKSKRLIVGFDGLLPDPPSCPTVQSGHDKLFHSRSTSQIGPDPVKRAEGAV
jgi:hypothetical protein